MQEEDWASRLLENGDDADAVDVGVFGTCLLSEGIRLVKGLGRSQAGEAGDARELD